MHRVEEQILIYSTLQPEERLRVDAYVGAHPELAPLLEEARRWSALLEEGRVLGAAEPTDEALAYWIATRRLDPRPVPPSLAPFFAALEARVAAQPALQARVAALEQRLNLLQAGTDPAAHFKVLTAAPPPPPGWGGDGDPLA